jgi:MFS family permease
MTTPQREALPAMFAALAVPNFRRYVSGQSLSLIGTWVETVAQALLVLKLTHSGTVLGLTTAARYAPILLLSPYAGLLVDRYSKRRVLLGTQAGLGLVSTALGAAVLAGTSGCGRWSSLRCCSASSARWTTRRGRRSPRKWSAAT